MTEKNRTYGGTMHIGNTVRLIIGLVTEERIMQINTLTPFEKSSKRHPLKLGVVVHASLIKETVDQLGKD